MDIEPNCNDNILTQSPFTASDAIECMIPDPHSFLAHGDNAPQCC